MPPAYRSGETDIAVTHPGGDPAGHGGAAFRAGFDAAVGNGRRPADADAEAVDAEAVDAEVVEELAEHGTDTAAELAQQVTGDEAATPDAPLPAAEQPGTDTAEEA